MHGVSDVSNIVVAKAASAPAKITILSTEQVGQDVKLKWTAPNLMGGTIQKYQIFIKNETDLVDYELKVLCDGELATVITNTYCLIPMSSFTGTLGYVVPDLILFKVKTYSD